MKEWEEEEDKNSKKFFRVSYSEMNIPNNGLVLVDDVGVLGTDSWFLLRRRSIKP